jgi:hypothetical protein
MCSAKEPDGQGQKVHTVSYDWLRNKANRYNDEDPEYAYWNSVADRVGPGGTTKITNVRTDASGGWSEYQDPYAGMMERMSEAMAQQAAMQAEYMNQMALLQEEQLKMQEEAAKAAMVENKKNPSDYAQANADDTARKQLLRRGLMSTFTRYGNANAGGGGKATKLGG